MSIFSLLAKPFEILAGSAVSIIDELHTSGEEKDAAKLALTKIMLEAQAVSEQIGQDAIDAQRDVIIAEVKDGSWLSSSWRPLSMLTLMGLIVWQVIFASVFDLQPDWQAVPDKAWGLITLGLGGYIGARSAEKIMKEKGNAAVRFEEARNRE